MVLSVFIKFILLNDVKSGTVVDCFYSL